MRISETFDYMYILYLFLQENDRHNEKMQVVVLKQLIQIIFKQWVINEYVIQNWKGKKFYEI